MANKKIRIRLKAYEHRTLDTAAAKIVETATRTGAFFFSIRSRCRSSVFSLFLRERFLSVRVSLHLL